VTVIGIILRAEHVAIAATGIVLYAAMGGSWLLYVPMWLAIDLSTVGYLGGPRLGAVTYNAAHNLVIALGLLGIGVLLDVAWVRLVASVWISHVGIDRSLGYGLKLPSDFRDTHLGRIGRERS
jgi:hypothetical protein